MTEVKFPYLVGMKMEMIVLKRPARHRTLLREREDTTLYALMFWFPILESTGTGFSRHLAFAAG